jgi:hypothetical protein
LGAAAGSSISAIFPLSNWLLPLISRPRSAFTYFNRFRAPPNLGPLAGSSEWRKHRVSCSAQASPTARTIWGGPSTFRKVSASNGGASIPRRTSSGDGCSGSRVQTTRWRGRRAVSQVAGRVMALRPDPGPSPVRRARASGPRGWRCQ